MAKKKFLHKYVESIKIEILSLYNAPLSTHLKILKACVKNILINNRMRA